MVRLYGYWTQNSMKPIYVAEELGIDYEFQFVDLVKGENRTDEIRALTPTGKVPLLQIDDKTLFESGAICRYLANTAHSPLYPEPPLERAWVDQWLDYFTCHLGRWLSLLYFETIIKKMAGMGDPDEKSCQEAQRYIGEQMTVVDSCLTNHPYLTGDQPSIADLFAFAYVEQIEPLKLSLADYPHLERWYRRLESRPSVKQARDKVVPFGAPY